MNDPKEVGQNLERSGQSGSDEDLKEILDKISQASLEGNSGLHTDPELRLHRLLDQQVSITHTPLTRSVTRGSGIQHVSLPYQNVRGPKKTVAGKLFRRSEEFEKRMTKNAEKLREEWRAQMAAQHEAELAAVRRQDRDA